MFTQRNATYTDGNPQGLENSCTVPLSAVDLTSDVEPHFDDYFGYQFEANIESNIQPNYNHVGDRENVVEEPVQRQTKGRHVQGDHPCCNAADMVGTSDVPKNRNISASDNQSTWVIPGSETYSFGQVNNTMGSHEPNTIIYKGQYFPQKKMI